MTHGNLFSGIGMWEYAAQMAGLQNIFSVEKDEFCQKVLRKNFNHSIYGDVKEFDGKEYCGTIDILTGSTPCQPFSLAGKQRGSADDRHLWGEYLSIVSEIQPKWVCLENVCGYLNSEDGLVFEQTLIDLEAAGYQTQTFVIPALGVDACHKRDRVWIIGFNPTNSDSIRHGRRDDNECGNEQRNLQSVECTGSKMGSKDKGCDRELAGATANTGFIGQTEQQQQAEGSIEYNQFTPNTYVIRLHKRESENNRSCKGGQPNGFATQVNEGYGAVTTNTNCERHLHGQYEEQPAKRGFDALGYVTSNGGERDVTNTTSKRLERGNQRQLQRCSTEHNEETWYEAATRLCGVDDAHTGELDGVNYGGYTKARHRNEQLKSLGNTIMWEIAYNIFESIKATV